MRYHDAKQKKLIALIVLCAVLAIAAAVCFIKAAALSNSLLSQKAAERWRGESEESFAQISCMLPVGQELQLTDVYTWRYAMIKAMEDAALNVTGENTLWTDAWSCSGKLNVSSAIGKGEAAVIAVGGSFFNFHPLRLISGSYIQPSDLMQDRVLLDEDLAWLLFGSTEIQGLSFDMAGRSFTVAGVIEREDNRATRLAYQSGMGLFMSYDTYKLINENAGISCYEFVMAEPVEGFARSTAETSFPVKTADIIDNSSRFELFRLLKLALKLNERGMQTGGAVYPYWENAARYTENVCGSLLILGCAFSLLPLITLTAFIVIYLRRGKTYLDEIFLPRTRDNIEESIRKTQRRRWERYHGKH